MSAAKYMGATFTLLMTVGSSVMGVWFALKEIPVGVASMAAMAVISGYVVAKKDWPEVWKPLLGL